MYYSEMIIEGVLYFKTTPRGDWIKMTEKQMTAKIQRLQAEVNRLNRI